MIIIDLGHIIAEIPEVRQEGKDGSWIYFNKLSEEEGFRLPTLKELGYLYSLKEDLNLEIPKDWYWSSEVNQRMVYDTSTKYYFFDFRTGVSDWEYANQQTCALIRIYEK